MHVTRYIGSSSNLNQRKVQDKKGEKGEGELGKERKKYIGQGRVEEGGSLGVRRGEGK